MLYSVALFGHHKYNYEIREKLLSLVELPIGTNYAGVQLYQEVWVNKVVGRYVEYPENYDPDLHIIYERTGNNARAIPGDIIAIRPVGHKWTAIEKKEFLIVQLDLQPEHLMGIVEPVWDLTSYPELPADFWDKYEGDVLSTTPARHLKKRRFNVSESTLESLGVDLDDMKNKDLEYVPEIRAIDRTEGHDKLKDRLILETDGLNVLAPVIIERPS